MFEGLNISQGNTLRHVRRDPNGYSTIRVYRDDMIGAFCTWCKFVRLIHELQYLLIGLIVVSEALAIANNQALVN
jgi:hypothetical protein